MGQSESSVRFGPPLVLPIISQLAFPKHGLFASLPVLISVFASINSPKPWHLGLSVFQGPVLPW